MLSLFILGKMMATVVLTIGRKILAEGRFATKYRHLQGERKAAVDLSTYHWLLGGVLIRRYHGFICNHKHLPSHVNIR